MDAQESQQENPRERIRSVVPKLVELTENVLFGDVWERPNPSKRDRSLITIAALVATYRPEQLRIHLGRALDNGLSTAELAELITHLAFYADWPAAGVAKTVFDERQ